MHYFVHKMTRITAEEIEIRQVFSSRLEMIMTKRNVKPAHLSRMSGVPKSTLAKYLRAETTAQIHVLSHIAKALNISTDYLLGRVEKPIDKMSPMATECCELIDTMDPGTQEYFLLLATSVKAYVDGLKKGEKFSKVFITNLK